MSESPTTTSGSPYRTALLVVGGAVLVVVGLLLGAALTASASASVPTEDSVDAGFARDMQVHHGQAVEMSVLLRDRSNDPAVRQVALDIELTQQNQQGQMFGWLELWGLPQSSTQPIMGWMSDAPFDSSNPDMTGMPGMDAEAGTDVDAGTTDGNPMSATGLASDEQLAALAAADAVEAERRYLELMISHHRGGAQMAEVAAARAEQPQVRRLAETMVVAQTAEITVLQDLLDERGGALDG